MILTLALGIGATTSLFSVADSVLNPLPFPDAGQLVSILETSTAKHQNASLVVPVRIRDWERDSRSFIAISGSYGENLTDTIGAQPERLAGRVVLPHYFGVFGITPLLGRTFTADEERYAGSTAVIISEGLWSRRFARSSAVLGPAPDFQGHRLPQHRRVARTLHKCRHRFVA